ncbi:hypothetical protein N7537_011558 [Penicillium hordei]|uniref:Uncharacterized protein n=1 Tax=Penicillium hordei TaxID=40994 RepID=A0AAD6DMM4_9EURO|nr:uncharacterized protein N7537_011558 [Penicillium hordei]KAJ5588880.1 hypothetical protein N7537_011558 [Penicillium hordei]
MSFPAGEDSSTTPKKRERTQDDGKRNRGILQVTWMDFDPPHEKPEGASYYDTMVHKDIGKRNREDGFEAPYWRSLISFKTPLSFRDAF